MEEDPEPVSRRAKLEALRDVARYRPRVTLGIVALGLFAAIFEGVGLSFILPIVELVQASDPAAQADGLMGLFFKYQRAIADVFVLV